MALFNVADVVDSFATGTYTVRRREPPTWSKGKKVPGAETTLQIQATIAPLSGEDLQRLDEGTRVEDVIQIVTTTELRTETVSGEADRVEYGDGVFEVEEVANWNALGGFWRCTARRQGAEEDT